MKKILITGASGYIGTHLSIIFKEKLSGENGWSFRENKSVMNKLQICSIVEPGIMCLITSTPSFI